MLSCVLNIRMHDKVRNSHYIDLLYSSGVCNYLFV